VEVTGTNRAAARGASAARTKEEDFVDTLFIASAHSYILLFTSKGRVYWLKVYELPESAAARPRQGHRQAGENSRKRKSWTALVAATNLEEKAASSSWPRKTAREKIGADRIF